MSSNNKTVSRISVSLPEHLLKDLDSMILERGFESRSQAICEMISQQINEHRQELGSNVMTGTLNLVYNHSVPGLQKKLHDLLYMHIDEVISSLNVNLTHTNTMTVVLVQGPANRLRMIANKMITLKGVLTGKLILSSSIIPPLHPLPEKTQVT